MIYFGVLCLAACVLSNPAVYVSRTSLDERLPYRYYYPMASPWVALAPEKDGAAKEFIIPAEPGKLPLASIVIEPMESKPKEEETKIEEEIEPKKDEESEGEEPVEEEHKEDESKEEEHEDHKEEEDKKEKPKLRLITAPGPVDVKFIKPPQFITDFIDKIPIKFPYDFPILGPIFGKPPASVPAPAPAPEPTPAVVRYRLAYPPMSSVPITYLAKK